MWKLKAAQYSLISSLALTSMHYSSHGYMWVEQKIKEHFKETHEAVVSALAKDLGYERPTPKMSELQAIDIVEQEALRRNINPALARALMKAESNGDRYAVSSAGALGYMQIMPQNSKRCKLKHYGELFDERKNIACGVQILAEELKAHAGDVVRALQAYNGGAGCVNKCSESINHARKVLTIMAGDIR